MDIKTVLDSGYVARYHNTLITNKQLNSVHQWETAIILKKIYPSASADLMFHALTHDVGELYTGDLPAPVKKRCSKIKKLMDAMEFVFLSDIGLEPKRFTKEEILAVKYADTLSGLYFTNMQLYKGDSYAHEIFKTWLEYYNGLDYLNEITDNVLEEIQA